MQFGCQFRVCFFPSGLLCFFRFGVSPFLVEYLGVEFGYFREDRERILGIATQVLDCLLDRSTRTRQRLSVGRHFIGEIFPVRSHGTFTHQGLTDNQRGTFFLLVCGFQGTDNLFGVVTVDREHVPSPSLVFGGSILVSYFVYTGRQLHFVGIVKHNEIG